MRAKFSIIMNDQSKLLAVDIVARGAHEKNHMKNGRRLCDFADPMPVRWYA